MVNDNYQVITFQHFTEEQKKAPGYGAFLKLKIMYLRHNYIFDDVNYTI